MRVQVIFMTPKRDINLLLAVSLWLARQVLPNYIEVESIKEMD